MGLFLNHGFNGELTHLYILHRGSCYVPEMKEIQKSLSVFYMAASSAMKPSRILSGVLNHVTKNCSRYSTQANTQQEIDFCSYRTPESNPIKHSFLHEAKFYTIPEITHKKLFTLGGFSKSYEIQAKTFREHCVMVRKPALEIMTYLNNGVYSAPAVRYIIYGRTGTGKSTVLAHVIHYSLEKNWLLVHVPWAPNWTRRANDTANSVRHPRRLDLPIDSALWLQHFLSQNSALLQELDLRISKTYTWSKRETTEGGEPLVNLIDKGVSRTKFASDCLAVLLKELKLHSQSGRFRTLVAIDGVNCFFGTTLLKRIEDKSWVEADEVTIVRAFKKLLLSNWNNAAIVMTVDGLAATYEENNLYTPRALLKKEGFEHLEPFVPIFVENYTEKEIDSCLDYYMDRKWLQHEKAHTEDGRTELKFLSGYNPYELMQLCAPL